MARETSTRLTQHRQTSITPAGAETRVSARPVDTFVAPAVDTELAGLLGGLSVLNPSITRLANASDAKAAEEAYRAGQQGGLDPTAPNQVPESMPDRVSPAFKDNFALGYRESIGAKLSAESTEALLAGYNKDRLRPDFNAEAYISEFQAKELAGVNDPVVRDSLVKSLPGSIKAIRQDAREVQMARLKENTISSNAASLRSAVSGDQDPAAMHASMTGWLEMAGGKNSSGFQSKVELMQMAFTQVQALSTAAGGDPSVFDVFNIPFPAGHDQAGKTMSDLNAGLKDNIESAKRAATAQRDARIKQGMQTQFYSQDLKWQQAAEAGKLPDAAEFAQHIGPGKMFSDHNQAFSRYSALRGAVAQVQDLTMVVSNYGTGEGWRNAGFSKDIQQRGMNQVTGPLVADLLKYSPAAQGGKVAPEFAVAMAQLVKVHANSGSDIHSVHLKAMLEGVKASAPTPGAAPTPGFLNAAALFKALPANLKGIYASEDTAAILDSYNHGVSTGGIDPATAMAQAFVQASPEAKAAAAKWAADPVNIEKVNGWAKNVPTSWVRDFFGVKWMGTYPTNEDVMQSATLTEAKRWKLNNPQGSEAQMKDAMTRYVETSWVYDKVSNKVINVPRGQTGEDAEKALGLMTSKATEEAVRLYGEGSTVVLQKSPDGDRYDLMAYPRGGGHVVNMGQTSMTAITAAHNAVREDRMTGEETAAFGALAPKIRKGTITPEELAMNDALLRKAKGVGALDGSDLSRVDAINRTAAQSLFAQARAGLPQVFPPMTGSLNMNVIDAAPKAGGAKARLATTFHQEGDATAALVTMGEGVRLTAYKDPATGAGMNIGIGYNFQGRGSRIASDFAKAKIPNDDASIQAIKEGRMSISEEQAQRLLKAVLPEYKEIARKAVEARATGLWDKLPEHQKAVLTDVAYQVGDVSQFKTALGHLMAGEAEAFGGALKVKYRKGADGAYVTDDPRNNLRSLMLSQGAQFFMTTINEASRKPASKLAALRQPGEKGPLQFGPALTFP